MNLEEIYLYISSELKEERVAKKLIKEIFESVNKLKYFPMRYPIIYSEQNLKLRKIRMKKYVIVYKIRNNKEIWILHIFHDSQNYFNLL